MKGRCRRVLSTMLTILLCFGALHLPQVQRAEGSGPTAVPGPGIYSAYQDVYLFNETVDESGIAYAVHWRPTQPSTPYTGTPVRIDEDVVLSVSSTVGSVTTYKEFSYTIKPGVLSVFPAEEAVKVPVDSRISFAFSRKMDQGLLETESNISITRISPTPVTDISSNDFTATYSPAAYTLDIQLNPGVTLEHGATYMVTLGGNIKDSNGKPLEGNRSFVFYTVSAGDILTHGSIATERTSYGRGHDVAVRGSYFRGSNAVNGAVDLQYQVFDARGGLMVSRYVNSVTNGRFADTFTLPGNAAAGNWTVRLYDGDSPRQLLGTCNFTVVESAVTAPEANFQPGTYYEPLTVNLSTPTPGATIYYTTDFTDNYSTDPVPVSIPSGQVDSSCTEYKGAIFISAPGKTRLRAVAIKGGVKSPLMDNTYTIRADLGYLDLKPGSGATGVSLLSGVSVTFGRQVKSQSVNAQTLRLREAGTGADVAGRVSYDAEKRVATFKPDGILKPNTMYQAILEGYTGGLDSIYIEDLNGVRLLNNIVWNFTTGPDWVTVDGRSVTGNYVAVNKTPAAVIVTSPDTVMVTLDKVRMAAIGGNQFRGEAALKPGNNTVTIEITDSSAVKTTMKINVNYLNLMQAGAGVTAGIPAKGKLELFDKQLVLEFPKGGYLTDGSGLPLSDQSIIFEIYNNAVADGSPSVSPVFEIRPKVPGARLNNAGEGNITLTYDKYVSSTASPTLTVLCDPDFDGEWEENLGGRPDTKKRTITLPFGSFGRYVIVNKVWSFSDYTTAGWARPYVEHLWAKGLMKPLPTAGVGQFGLTDAQGREMPITRGEFAVLVGRVLGLNKSGYSNYGVFTDMRLFGSSSTPYALAKDLDGFWRYIDDDDYKYIDMLARNGIVNGSVDEYGSLVFNYFSIISREEVAVILARAMNLAVETDDAKYRAAITKLYTDAGTSMAPWAQPYVLAVSKGYFGGYPDKTFRGKDNFTRPQAARVIYMAMKKNKLM